VVSALGVGRASAAASGKQIFPSGNCNMCHSVPTAGVERKVKSDKVAGPDLVHFELEPTQIQRFLRKEPEIDGKKHGKAFTGTDEDLGALVQWILSQKQ
jgi:mono/diheme cytochrome c family protein